MADLKAQLEISADASGVEAGIGKAKRSLADLGATAQAAGAQAGAGLEKVGAGAEGAGTKVDRATQNIIGSIQRTTAALEAGGRSSSEYFALLGQQRGVNTEALKPYLDQLDAVTAKQKIAAQSIVSAAAPIAQVGMSARATAAALRQVPAQFTDIVTSLQAGQAPLTVLLQQGGQLKDVFGGIGPAARALGSYILGLVNPFTIAAAAAAAIGYAFLSGGKEAIEYAKAIILTGNAAGVTVGQLSAMAKSISAVAGTQAAAAEALTALASTGQVAGQNLEGAAQAAVRFERTAGQAISETVKQFEELGKSPVDASVKLNEKLHYLTLTTYAQIKALQDQGKEAEAAAAAQKAYADALDQRATQIEARLGLVERAWRGVKDAAKGAWDSMLNVGRASTLQDQLSGAQRELEQRLQRGPLNSGTTTSFEKGNQALRDRIAALNESITADNRSAAAQKASSDQVAARIKFDKEGEQFTTNAVKMEREITKARNEGKSAGASLAEIEKRISDIRAKYTDKGAAKSLLQIDKAELSSDIAAIKSASDRLTGIFQNQEKVLEATRSAGGLGDEEYYRKKRELIIATTEVEDYALQQQIKRYEQEKLTGKDAIDNQKKIAETESRLAILRADNSAKLTVLSIQQEGAAKKLQLSFLTARQAAQDYFDSLERQQNRNLSAFGQGTEKREFNAGVNQIEDRYAGQRRDLENTKAQLELEGKFTDEARAQYEERLSIIKEFQEKSLASYADYFARLKEKQADAALGAKEALQNYTDDAAKVGKGVEAVVGKTLGGIEDSLVELATTGSTNFKSLANSIISDLIRIQIRSELAGLLSGAGGPAAGGGLFGQLLSAGASYFGGGSSSLGFSNAAGISGGRATGGPVSSGGLYRVNEKAPEVLHQGGRTYLMPSADGKVSPQSGGASTTINSPVYVTVSGNPDRRSLNQVAAAAGSGVQRATARLR